MTHRRLAAAFTFVFALLCGCGDTAFEEATGKGQIRGINGLVGAANLQFRIEETALAELPYKGASAQAEYDNLSYRFNFDVPTGDGSTLRLASRFIDVVEDTEYTFVAAGPTANPDVLLWERANPVWDGSESVFDIGIGHASNTLGTVDVYIAAPGTLPVLGNAFGTVAFGERTADTELAEGDYEVIVTAQNDPADVLFTSQPLTISPATSYDLVVFDPDASITSGISVRLINLAGGSTEIGDVNSPPTARFINAAFGSGNIDVVADNDFANPLVSDLPFGAVSSDVDIVQGPIPYNYTPPASTTPLATQDLAVSLSTRAISLLVGQPGSLSVLNFASDRRGFSTLARFRLTNASSNAETIDVYLTDPGQEISLLNLAVFSLPFGEATDFSLAEAQDYEITVTRTGSATPLLGPQALTLAVNEMREIVILDTADPNTVDVLTFEFVNP